MRTIIVAVVVGLVLVGSVNATPTSNYTVAKRAIYATFGGYASQAMRVSYCETGGTYSVWARNGQYLGLFQMGSYARSRYGHANNAWGQARAAYRYFVDSGRDWSPWSCKP